MKNKLTEEIIRSFQKRFEMDKDEAAEKGINGIDRKAFVIIDGKTILPGEKLIDGKKIEIIPRCHQDYIPIFTIDDSDRFEEALKQYLQAVEETNIKSTQMNARHNERYFIFNIWKNATNYDFQNPVDFIKRYTDFIKDDTFSQYDDLTVLGKYENNMLMVKREEDDYGFETPYIMHFSLTNGKYIYNLPWVRYGITKKADGEKMAYIYALQNMDPSPNESYNMQIRKSINKVNSGVNKFRNVTPSSIATLGIFLGMLEREGIHSIRVPDFLIGRYGRFCNADSEKETDRIQTNLTDKFLRNFLRLSQQLDNVNLEGFDGFLWVKLRENNELSNRSALHTLYNLGRGKKVTFSPQERDER